MPLRPALTETDGRPTARGSCEPGRRPASEPTKKALPIRKDLMRCSHLPEWDSAGFGTDAGAASACRLPGFIGPCPPPLLIRVHLFGCHTSAMLARPWGPVKLDQQSVRVGAGDDRGHPQGRGPGFYGLVPGRRAPATGTWGIVRVRRLVSGDEGLLGLVPADQCRPGIRVWSRALRPALVRTNEPHHPGRPAAGPAPSGPLAGPQHPRSAASCPWAPARTTDSPRRQPARPKGGLFHAPGRPCPLTW